MNWDLVRQKHSHDGSGAGEETLNESELIFCPPLQQNTCNHVFVQGLLLLGNWSKKMCLRKFDFTVSSSCWFFVTSLFVLGISSLWFWNLHTAACCWYRASLFFQVITIVPVVLFDNIFKKPLCFPCNVYCLLRENLWSSLGTFMTDVSTWTHFIVAA